MGEKPLSIDEAPLPATTINTTRSNIKTQGAVGQETTEAGGGDGAVAEEAVGTDHGSDVAGMAIKEQGVLKSTSTGQGSGHTGGTVNTGGNMVAPGPTVPSDLLPPVPDPGGAAVGPVRPGSPGPTYPDDTSPPNSAGGDGSTGGMAAEGNPIPGIDVKLGKNRLS